MPFDCVLEGEVGWLLLHLLRNSPLYFPDQPFHHILSLLYTPALGSVSVSKTRSPPLQQLSFGEVEGRGTAEAVEVFPWCEDLTGSLACPPSPFRTARLNHQRRMGAGGRARAMEIALSFAVATFRRRRLLLLR